MQITKPKAKQLLRDVVRGNESYVYRSEDHGDRCVYEYDGKPSCVVGQVLYRAGVSIDVLAELDDLDYSSFMDDDPVDVLKEAGLTMTKPARNLLVMVQTRQDQGISWGSALAVAEKE